MAKMNSEEGKAIRKLVLALESKAAPIDEFRQAAKTEGGRMSDFGREILGAAKRNGVQQSLMARVLGITPGAVSQHYNR
jgi:hypothetical protein